MSLIRIFVVSDVTRTLCLECSLYDYYDTIIIIRIALKRVFQFKQLDSDTRTLPNSNRN